MCSRYLKKSLLISWFILNCLHPAIPKSWACHCGWRFGLLIVSTTIKLHLLRVHTVDSKLMKDMKMRCPPFIYPLFMLDNLWCNTKCFLTKFKVKWFQFVLCFDDYLLDYWENYIHILPCLHCTEFHLIWVWNDPKLWTQSVFSIWPFYPLCHLLFSLRWSIFTNHTMKSMHWQKVMGVRVKHSSPYIVVWIKASMRRICTKDFMLSRYLRNRLSLRN